MNADVYPIKFGINLHISKYGLYNTSSCEDRMAKIESPQQCSSRTMSPIGTKKGDRWVPFANSRLIKSIDLHKLNSARMAIGQHHETVHPSLCARQVYRCTKKS